MLNYSKKIMVKDGDCVTFKIISWENEYNETVSAIVSPIVTVSYETPAELLKNTLDFASYYEGLIESDIKPDFIDFKKDYIYSVVAELDNKIRVTPFTLTTAVVTFNSVEDVEYTVEYTTFPQEEK